MNYREAKERAKVLKAISHPMRILIIEALKDGDKCGRELCALGHINQSNVSRHLSMLKKVGVVSDRREQTRVFYRLEAPSVLKTLDPAAEAVRVDRKRRKVRTESI
jgi:ArsR family transcriptional regulator